MSLLSKLFGGIFGGAKPQPTVSVGKAPVASLAAVLATIGTPRFRVALAKGNVAAVAPFADRVVEITPADGSLDAVIVVDPTGTVGAAVSGSEKYYRALRYGGHLVVLATGSTSLPKGYLAVSSGTGYAVYRRV